MQQTLPRLGDITQANKKNVLTENHRLLSLQLCRMFVCELSNVHTQLCTVSLQKSSGCKNHAKLPFCLFVDKNTGMYDFSCCRMHELTKKPLFIHGLLAPADLSLVPPERYAPLHLLCGQILSQKVQSDFGTPCRKGLFIKVS